MNQIVEHHLPEAEDFDASCEVLVHHKDLAVTVLTDAQRKEVRATRLRPHGIDYAEDIRGFVDLVARFQTPTTVIFASGLESKLTAVINHDPASAVGDASGGWKDRRIVYELKRSSALKAWEELGRLHAQEPFAEFLEEHAGEIIHPEAADIREVALNLVGTTGAEFVSRKNLTNGDIQLSWQDKTTTNVAVPGKITVRIPLFEGAAPVTLQGLIRFRVKDRAIGFAVVFPTLETEIKTYFQHLVEQLKNEETITSPVVVGRIGQ